MPVSDYFRNEIKKTSKKNVNSITEKHRHKDICRESCNNQID